MFGRKKYDFYLAGPMRGYPDLNRPMFIRVANLLREKGFTVWSPAEHGSYLKSSFGECMIRDLDAVINQCDGIALLPGWRESIGANAEMFCAFVCNKEATEISLVGQDLGILTKANLNEYYLPYSQGEQCRIDPHSCSADTPLPESLETPEGGGDACDR